MKLFQLVPVILSGALTACAVESPDVSSTGQAECAGLPHTTELREWRGDPLFAAGTARTATLAYSYGDAGFIAYGIDVDARAVVWVMHGDVVDLDGFLGQLLATDDGGVISNVIVTGGGSGGGPRPSGDPPFYDPTYLVGAAVAASDSFSSPPSCSP